MSETFIDANGLIWENRGTGTDDHLAFGGHEPQILEIAKSLLPQGGCFLDVGAHVGLYTLNLASKARDVYAVEANPKTYDVLLRNVQANADKHPDATIHAINMAAWDEFDTLKMVDENGFETGGSTHCEPLGSAVSLNTTTAAPLDAILPEHCAPDLVKIDVEGAEGHVLRGMLRLLIMHKPVLLIEMHDVVYNKPEVREHVINILNGLNYRWNDDLTFSVAYYIVARPDAPEEFEIEIVKAGQ